MALPTDAQSHNRPDDDKIAVGEAIKPADTELAAPPESDFVNLTKLQALRVFWKPCMLGMMAMVSVTLDGYAQSVPGNIISNKGFIEQFGTVTGPNGAKVLDSRHVSLWGGFVIVGMIPGQQLGGLISDKYGRVAIRIALTVTLLLATIMEIFSREFGLYLAAKFFVGVGTGMMQASAVVYVVEIVPTQIRGSLICLYGAFLAIGQLGAAVALQIVNKTDPDKWLRCIYSQFAMHGLWLLCLPWLPESPWWHARGKREEACKKVLWRINKNVPGYNVDREYLSMIEEIQHEEARRKEAKGTSYREIFTYPNLKRTIGSTMGLGSLQFAGNTVVFTYASYFFQQAGVKEPFQATCIVYGLTVFGTLCSVFYLTEKLGRRPLLLTGLGGCTIGNFIIGGLGFGARTDPLLNATLGVICIWVLFYAVCLAGVAWGYSAEVASPRLRAKTTACVQSMYTCLGIISNFTVPLMLATSGPGARNWGLKTLFLYALLGTFALAVNYFVLPEVRGRTYHELDEMYEKNVPPRKMRQYISRVEQEGTKTHI